MTTTYDNLQVDIGNAPNDDQGDTLRDAFYKINQRFAELRIFANGRGDWAPSTVYTANPNRDWVIVDGVGYLATSNHTSGATFAADLAAGKWVDYTRVQDASLADYAALRAYTGQQTRVYLTGPLGTAKPAGIAGAFNWDPSDTTSADNGGTVIVGSDGRRWKRDYSGAVDVQWFGAKPQSNHDSRPNIQAAIDAHPGRAIAAHGSYHVWGTITVSAASTVIQGGGARSSSISQRTPNVDTLVFKPPTAGATADFLTSPSITGLTVDHTSVAASSTEGAGVRFLQCNGYKLFDVTVNNAPEGITVQGGQLGSLKSFQIYASSGLTATPDSALLYLRQAPVGSGFQPCYTVNIEDFRLSATKLRETCIYLRNADGAQFVNGYVAFGQRSLVKVMAERANSSVTATSFTGVYLDCVNSTGTLYGIELPEDGFANTFVYMLKLGSGSIIGNGAGVGVLCRKQSTMLLSVEGATILNMGSWAIDCEGTNELTDLHVNGSSFQNCGDAVSGVIRAVNGRSINIVGNAFSSNKNLLVSLGGSFTQGAITGNSNSSSIAELVNTATFANPLVVAGNSGRIVSAQSWRGVRPGNVEIDIPTALDWYEEGVFTPRLTIGGGNTGITYSQQIGTFTRIGNRVFYSLRLALNSKGALTGEVNIAGLPYNSSDANISYPAPIRITNVQADLGATHMVADMFGTSTAMRILWVNTAGSTELQAPVTEAQITDSTIFVVNGSYRCA